MVHAIQRSPHQSPQPFRHARLFAHLQPDSKRIAGLAMAIALNAGLLMLLLVPLTGPPALSLPDPSPILVWITPKPVILPPPVKIPIAKSHPRPDPVITRPQLSLPVDEPVAIATAQTQMSEPMTQLAVTPELPGDAAPLAGVRLEYADVPAPTYPRDALADGVHGTVLLQVLVDTDGRPLQVDVQRSSGDRRLDLAARRQVLEHWRFRPAMREGRAVQAIGLVPIGFNLGD